MFKLSDRYFIEFPFRSFGVATPSLECCDLSQISAGPTGFPRSWSWPRRREHLRTANMINHHIMIKWIKWIKGVCFAVCWLHRPWWKCVVTGCYGPLRYVVCPADLGGWFSDYLHGVRHQLKSTSLRGESTFSLVDPHGCWLISDYLLPLKWCIALFYMCFARHVSC